MTCNEFKLYCIFFCEKYKGMTFGEVFPDVCHFITKIKVEFEKMVISKNKSMYGKESGYLCILGSNEKLLYLNNIDRWVKIPENVLKFEDIV